MDIFKKQVWKTPILHFWARKDRRFMLQITNMDDFDRFHGYVLGL